MSVHRLTPCVLAVVGVYTAYKPYLSKDEEIIKQLQKVKVSERRQQNVYVRLHLQAFATFSRFIYIKRHIYKLLLLTLCF